MESTIYRNTACHRLSTKLAAAILCIVLFSLPAAAKVKLTFATGLSETSFSALKVRLDEFQRQNPDIELEILRFAGFGQVREKLFTMIASGDAPDVVHTSPNNAPEYIDNNMLYDVTDYARQLKQTDYIFSDMYTRNGRVFGGYETHVQVDPVYINNERFSTAGIASPNEYAKSNDWNWETFLTVAKKLTRVGADGRVEQYAARIPISWADAGWGSFRLAAGAELFTRDQRMAMNTPEMYEALRFFNGLLEAHVIPRPGESLGTGDPFLTGKIAMDFNQSFRMQYYIKNGGQVDWDIAPTPLGPRGNQTYRCPGADGLVVSTTKHPDEAWRLVKFFLSDYVQEDKAKTKLEVPILRRSLQSRYFMQVPPKSMSVIVDLLNRSVAPPLFMGSTEAAALVNTAMLPAFKGDISLENGIAEAQRLGQAKLDAMRMK